MRADSGSPLLRPFAVYALLGIAQPATWLIMLPVYVAWLPPSQFSMLVLALFTARLFTVAANLKLDAAMRTFYFDFAADPVGLRRYLSQVLIASTAMALLSYLLILALGEPAYRLLFAHDELRFFPAGAIAVATACVNACLAPYFVYLRNGTKLRELALLQLGIVAGSVLLQLLFVVVLGQGIRGVLFGALLPPAVALCYVLARHISPASVIGLVTSLGPSLRYAMPLIVFTLFFLLERRLDVLTLEHFLGLDALAGYAMLISLLGLLAFALNALDSAIRPLMFPLLAAPDAGTRAAIRRFRRLYYTGGAVTLLLVAVCTLGIDLVTDDAAFLAAQSWVLPGVVAFAPGIVTRFNALFFDYHKRSIEVTSWIVIRTLLMGLLLLATVPAFGIAGALFAIFISQLANAIVFAITARRRFSV